MCSVHNSSLAHAWSGFLQDVQNQYFSLHQVSYTNLSDQTHNQPGADHVSSNAYLAAIIFAIVKLAASAILSQLLLRSMPLVENLGVIGFLHPSPFTYSQMKGLGLHSNHRYFLEALEHAWLHCPS